MSRILAALLSVPVLSFCNVALAQPAGTFTPTGNMSAPRYGHAATLLTSGKVLIAGGSSGGYPSLPTSSAELYDPSIGIFTPAGNMNAARMWHSATLLPDGRVLIAGGFAGGQGPDYKLVGSAEIYDPSTGTFTAIGNLITNRVCHSAILLGNGKVLIVGGSGYDHPLQNAELYDPAKGLFAATGAYASNFGSNDCHDRTSSLLPDGRVLVIDEYGDAELYDPDSGTFTAAGRNLALSTNEGLPTATLLPNGKVLLAGGATDGHPYDSAELYDLSTGKFTAIGKMTRPHGDHSATLLRDGTVLIAGSRLLQSATSSAELYDSATGTFTATADMTPARWGHTATLLMDGRVLVAGGLSSWPGGYSYGAELYVPSVLIPAQVVTDLQFDRTSVVAGFTFSAEFSGSNLTAQTFFDVRFTGPGSNDSAVVLNWQRGLAASHVVAAGTALGQWTINGVRAHEIETDHTGSFFPVSATIIVSP